MLMWVFLSQIVLVPVFVHFIDCLFVSSVCSNIFSMDFKIDMWYQWFWDMILSFKVRPFWDSNSYQNPRYNKYTDLYGSEDDVVRGSGIDSLSLFASPYILRIKFWQIFDANDFEIWYSASKLDPVWILNTTRKRYNPKTLTCMDMKIIW